EEMEAWTERSPLVIQRILLRSRHDVIVARQLQSALRASRAHRWEDANRALEEARRLAPDFSEVHRVEAYVRAEEGNVPAALAAYEAAVELAPSAAATRYWFGGFLLRSASDSAGAAEQFRCGLDADPDSPDLHVELARALLYQRAFADAEKELSWCFQRLASLPSFTKIKAETLVLSLYARRADHSSEELRDPALAAQDLDRLSGFYDTIPPADRDWLMLREVEKARLTAERLVHRRDEAGVAAGRFLTWLAGKGCDGRAGGPASPTPVFGEGGKVAAVKGGYGFIELDNGGSIFFHSSALVGCAIGDLSVGRRVTLERGVDSRGRPRAARVAPAVTASASDAP
ncbi:MAG: cold shock domain-containing protein, partial [Thermoplasmata archaeon]